MIYIYIYIYNDYYYYIIIIFSNQYTFAMDRSMFVFLLTNVLILSSLGGFEPATPPPPAAPY